MEQSNKIQRSEVWEQIYKVISKIPRKDVEGDVADAPSVATELEELFLKLLPIHDVMLSLPTINEIEAWAKEQAKIEPTGAEEFGRIWGAMWMRGFIEQKLKGNGA